MTNITGGGDRGDLGLYVSSIVGTFEELKFSIFMSIIMPSKKGSILVSLAAPRTAGTNLQHLRQ